MITWDVQETKTVPTLCISKYSTQVFFVYSKYDPEKEISRWISTINIIESKKKIVIVGMGLGYHVKAIIEKYPNKEIVVWELNEEFYYWFKESKFNQELKKISDTVEYHYLDSKEKNLNNFMELLSNKENELIVIRPLLELVPAISQEIKDILLNFEVNRRSYKSHEEKIVQNFYKNITRNDEGIIEWLEKFINQPMILVSAGPSLTKQLPMLVNIFKKSKVIIGCVGTALNPLLLAGIKPNFVMISESNENIEQFKNLNNENIPLFYLSTANNKTVEHYPGPKYVVWQKGFDLAENEACKRYEPLILTGGSVATCLLDLMVNMRPKSIALVGQDLAFTDNMSHAVNTHGFRTNISDTVLSVDNFYLNGKVSTSRNLLIYLKWFEHYLLSNKSKTIFWNCTEGGAYIKGWDHKSLYEYENIYLN